MDVRCDRCGSEYEFDDALLGANGTTVKCADCAHVFRLMPPGREPSRPTLRWRKAGVEESNALASIRELQRLIQVGAVTEDDELGRPGIGWRRLGDVAELKTFFVNRGIAAGARGQGTMLGGGAAPAVHALQVTDSIFPSGSGAAREDVAKRTLIEAGPGQIPKPPRLPSVPGFPVVRSEPTLTGYTRSVPPPVPSAPGKSVRPVGAEPSAAAGKLRSLYVEDDDAPERRRAGGKNVGWIWGGAGVAGAVAVWLAISIAGGAQSGAPSASSATAPPAGTEDRTLSTTRSEAVAAPAAAMPSSPVVEPLPTTQAIAPAPAVVDPSRPSRPSSPSPSRATPSADRGSAGAARSVPNDYGAQVNEAGRLFDRGDLAGAQALYGTALGGRANGSEANAGMGFVLLASNRPAEALPYFTRAEDNGFAEASVGLGDARRRLGNVDAALEAYQRYLMRLPNGGRADYARGPGIA